MVGQWWLPGDPENSVGGTLYIDSSGESSLELAGVLYRPGERTISEGVVRITEQSDPQKVVFGAADGKFVTLIDVIATGSSENWGPQAFTSHQILKPAAVVVGIHLNSPEEALFNGIDVEIDNLTAWSGITGIRTRYEVDRFRVSGYDIGIPEEISANVADLTLKLKWKCSSTRHVRSKIGGNEIWAQESVFLRIEGSGEVPWNYFHPTLKSFQDLLTLATRYPCSIRQKRLIRKDSSGNIKNFDLFHRGSVEAQVDGKVRGDKFLFWMQDRDFQSLLDSWVPLHRNVGLAIHILFGLDYDRRQYFENQLFNVVSTAEALHRTLFPNAVGIPVEEHRGIVRAIEGVIADKGHREWVKGRLRNDPGFKDRLLELAKIPDQEAVLYLLTDVDRWAKWVRDARNSLAHLDEAKLLKIPEGARYRLVHVTSALMHLVLLEKLGISAEHQRRAVHDVYGYSARRFKEEVLKCIN